MTIKTWDEMSVAERREHWATKLESGEYEQAASVLRDGEKSFCCLGVLCHIANQEAWTETNVGYHFAATVTEGDRENKDDDIFSEEKYDDEGVALEPIVGTVSDAFRSMPPAALINAVGLHYDDAVDLARFNDNGTPFKDIAASLRERPIR